VGFLPLKTSEHMAALGMFGLAQIYAFVLFIQSSVGREGKRPVGAPSQPVWIYLFLR
jgi:hypothetical protein